MTRQIAFGLLGATALFIAACGSSTPKANPQTSLHSGAPAASVPTTSSSARAAPPCSISQLRISAGSGQGAAGNFAFPIILRNTSATVCSLAGYPVVSWVTSSGAQIGAPAREIHDPASPASTVNLSPGASAYAEVMVPTPANQQLAGCRSTQAAGITVLPPGSTSSVLLTSSSSGLDRGSLTYCDIPAGSGGVLPVKATG